MIWDKNHPPKEYFFNWPCFDQGTWPNHAPQLRRATAVSHCLVIVSIGVALASVYSALIGSAEIIFYLSLALLTNSLVHISFAPPLAAPLAAPSGSKAFYYIVFEDSFRVRIDIFEPYVNPQGESESRTIRFTDEDVLFMTISEACALPVRLVFFLRGSREYVHEFPLPSVDQQRVAGEQRNAKSLLELMKAILGPERIEMESAIGPDTNHPQR